MRVEQEHAQNVFDREGLFEGIWESSSDVQGLVVASWVGFGFVGGFSGMFLGPVVHWLISRGKAK